VITYIPFTLLMAAGRSHLIAKIYWAELLPYLLLVWMLVSRFGAGGAAAAWSLRIVADCLILLNAARWLTGIRLELFPILRILLTGSILIVPIILMFVTSLPILAIGLVYLVFLGLYSVLLWRFVLTESEIGWLRLRLSAISSFRFNT
jgi:O-antigen/teichoic acid export membrane protein